MLALKERENVRKPNLHLVFTFGIKVGHYKYESLKGLFIFLRFKNNPKKMYKSDCFGWKMAMILCEIVECKMKEVLNATKYFSMKFL